MKSCLNCKQTEKTLFESFKKCIYPESEYYGEMVQKKDLCRYWELESD